MYVCMYVCRLFAMSCDPFGYSIGQVGSYRVGSSISPLRDKSCYFNYVNLINKSMNRVVLRGVQYTSYNAHRCNCYTQGAW